MPQKRNPVALEHARAIASKAVGQANAILFAVHNTPFGDIVDTEDDLQPLVFSMFNDAARALQLVAAALTTASFNRERLAERASQGWITVTELADTLSREHGLSFKASHTVAARFVAAATGAPGRPLTEVLSEASSAVTGRAIAYTPEALAEILSPQHFVRVRTTPGGPAPAVTARALNGSRELLESDRKWLTNADGALRSAEAALVREVAAL